MSKSAFGSLASLAGGTLNASEFTTVTSDAAAATASELIVYNSTNGKLFYNQNGAAANFGTGQVFVTLTNFATIGAFGNTNIHIVS